VAHGEKSSAQPTSRLRSSAGFSEDSQPENISPEFRINRPPRHDFGRIDNNSPRLARGPQKKLQQWINDYDEQVERNEEVKMQF